MGRGDYKDLRAYQLARTLARDLRQSVSRWDSFDQWSLGIQLLRAADSIAANIAESSGRWHPPDQLRLLYIARGSLHETEHWILVANERGVLDITVHESLQELHRTLNGLIHKRRR